MVATGKRSRRMSGLNRAQLRRKSHTHKSPDKVRRMGWVHIKKDHK